MPKSQPTPAILVHVHMPRILITGVSGFLGGALGRHLRAQGHHITGLSRTPPRPGSTDTFYPCDLTRDALPTQSFDAIIHCAALASPWAPTHRFANQNIEATRRLLTLPTGHFLFISTSSVHYTWGDQFHIRESDPLPKVAINEYARTKREAEQIVEQSRTNHTILRPRAIFGPEDTVLFPRILRAAKSGTLPRITREDNKPTLADLIYIDNLTHYIHRALELQATGTYNLTNAEPVDTFLFLQQIFADLNYPPIKKQLPSRWAFRLAKLLECTSALTGNHWEPPLTRFGVEVMIHSKTFDPTKTMDAFGPPPIKIEDARQRFVSWQRKQNGTAH